MNYCLNNTKKNSTILEEHNNKNQSAFDLVLNSTAAPLLGPLTLAVGRAETCPAPDVLRHLGTMGDREPGGSFNSGFSFFCLSRP